MGQRCSNPSFYPPPVLGQPEFNVEMNASQVIRALEFVSRKLQKNRLHIQLVVSGEALQCLKNRSRSKCHELNVITATKLSPRAERVLAKARNKAVVEQGLGPRWINSCMDDVEPEDVEGLLYNSLLQNEVVFSSEGLTLLAVDSMYSLKAKLRAMSASLWPAPEDLDSAVQDLRPIVMASRGRPLSRGYIRRTYRRLDVSDHVLLKVNAAYEQRYGTRGVVGVADEYMSWRRDGVAAWEMDFQLFGSELEMALRGGGCGAWDGKALPDTPHTSIIQQIFSKELS